MLSKPAISKIPLPDGWPRRVRSAVVHRKRWAPKLPTKSTSENDPPVVRLDSSPETVGCDDLLVLHRRF